MVWLASVRHGSTVMGGGGGEGKANKYGEWRDNHGGVNSGFERARALCWTMYILKKGSPAMFAYSHTTHGPSQALATLTGSRFSS